MKEKEIKQNLKSDQAAEQDLSVNDFLDSLVEQAAAERASDIHIEPLRREVRIRFRIDGALQERYTLPLDNLEYLINRIKILSDLDISNKPTPQDGHFAVDTYRASSGKQSDKVDVRVSVYPTVSGEAAVLRILNQKEMLLSLKELGMDPMALDLVKKLVKKSYGMVLTTGPTGSGKTTTLYSMIMELDNKEQNIMTLEDPVEFYFDDIRQSQIKPDLGFTFAAGMKSALRQDPDVLMIGEIRDPDTAEHAVQASLSGRRVFSTIHSNTTVGTIARLIDMDIDRGLIAYSLNGVISQRLVRKICPHCKTNDAPDPELMELLDFGKEKLEFKKGRGCEHCNQTGFQGRVGVFEVLMFDPNLRALIVDKAPMNTLEDYALKAGMKTLKQDVSEKAANGTTTVGEAVKIL